MGSAQDVWQAVLGNLELSISKAKFTTWLKNTKALENSGERLIVGVPNMFTQKWLKNKFHQNIMQTLKNISPDIKQVEYRLVTKFKNPTSAEPNSEPKIERVRTETSQPTRNSSINTGLNPKYIFESFIVGSNNELASAAAQAITKNLGKSYNPLFIYGGVGLGKTHLMQAIGNQVAQDYKDKRVLYVTTEKFTNDFVQAVRDNRGNQFKNTYRNVDLLLIDDVQFLAGKEQTQEEFFHTFNALHQDNKQIVLSSDRLPKEIPAIEERLVSRFEWGMVADVQSPDFETRLAILKAKARSHDHEIDPAILEYLAQTIETNIRELEGSLNRLVVYCQLNNTNPSLEKVRDVLSNIIFSPKKRGVSPKKVMEVAADFYNITMEDLVKKSRKKEYVYPRQIAMFIIRRELETSLPMIGELFGGRDHTTVIHAVDKIDKLAKSKETARQELSLITDRMYAD